MAPSDPPPQTFEKILNFRDVATSINAVTHHPILKPSFLFRSGLPDDATLSDQSLLRDTYHIKTILDLRTDSEHLGSAKHNAKRHFSSSPVTSPGDPAKPLRIPGVEYSYISLNGHAYSGALIKQLSYVNRAKLYGLYIIGYRNEAISVLGPNVMAKRGLVGLAEDSLTHSRAEVKSIFDVLADEMKYPVLVHCTQGKDRTGLTVLLVLLLLGVPVEAIEKDYMKSEKELESEREERLPQIRKIGLPDDFAGCSPGWAAKIANWIQEQYGGIRPYLETCRVNADQQDRVIRILSTSNRT